MYKSILLVLFTILIATSVVAQSSESAAVTQPAPSASASPASPSPSASLPINDQSPADSTTPSSSPLSSMGLVQNVTSSLTPSPVSTTTAPSPSTTGSAGAQTTQSNSPGAASASPSPTSGSTSCYCSWVEIPSLDKDGNGTAPGSLAYGAAVSNSLNFLAVSATLQDGGRGGVDIYTRFANFPYWTYRTNLAAGRAVAANNYFGQFVSMLGDSSVVIVEINPAATLYSYERTGPSTWANVQAPFPLNVSRVTAMQAYGLIMVVAYSGRPSGVDIYTKTNSQWTRYVRFPNPEGTAGGQYSQISIGQGNIFTAITSSGSVHIFTKNNAGVWSAQAITGLGTLTSVAVSKDRTTLAVATGSLISLYTAFGNRTFPATPDATVGSFTSTTVSVRFNSISNIQLQGGYMIVADTGVIPASLPLTTCTPSASTGAVYVFSRVGVNTISQAALRPRAQEDGFGRSLSYSSTQGNIIVVGGVYDALYTFILQSDVRLDACPSASPSPVSSQDSGK